MRSSCLLLSRDVLGEDIEDYAEFTKGKTLIYWEFK
jgi:hypothetical protein